MSSNSIQTSKGTLKSVYWFHLLFSFNNVLSYMVSKLQCSDGGQHHEQISKTHRTLNICIIVESERVTYNVCRDLS